MDQRQSRRLVRVLPISAVATAVTLMSPVSVCGDLNGRWHFEVERQTGITTITDVAGSVDFVLDLTGGSPQFMGTVLGSSITATGPANECRLSLIGIVSDDEKSIEGTLSVACLPP